MPTPATQPSADLAAALESVGRLICDPTQTTESALRRVCEVAAAALGVARVGVWLLAGGGRTLRCLTVYERAGGQHSQGSTLCTADFPRYIAALTADPLVPVADGPADPRTGELAEAYLRPLGITALLDARVLGPQGVLGVVCHEHSGGPREWTEAERAFAGELALLLTGPLLAASARGADAPSDRGLLDRLAAGVAHDFKNLLTVVLGYAEVLARRAALADEDREALGQIAAAAERGSALADDLMLIANDRPRRTAVLSPARLIEESLPLLRSIVGPRHELAFDGRAREGRVFLDPSSLNRVVTNLVVNARDASPEGASILVGVRDEAADGRHFECIEVADRGAGIDPAVRDRLFEPFVSTKAAGRGTGLGLAVVKQIVDRAGGTIRVEARPGGGTSFKVYLPRVACEAAGDS